MFFSNVLEQLTFLLSFPEQAGMNRGFSRVKSNQRHRNVSRLQHFPQRVICVETLALKTGRFIKNTFFFLLFVFLFVTVPT